MFKRCAVVILLCVFTIAFASGMVFAQDTPTPSPYSDLLDGQIRGMDEETIQGYLEGSGLGMALPAELNGYPGSRHVIDLADDLALSEAQLTEIQALYDTMRPQAIALGEQILAAEAALELAFRERTIDEAYLQSQLDLIGDLQAQLRFVHLRTHLATIEILNEHQVMLYNQLRGYASPAGMPHQHGGHGG